MATVSVTDYIQGEDIYTTMGDTADAGKDFDTYVFPNWQNYIRITNNGEFDLLLVAGKYTHTIIHPGDTFAADVDFKSFDIKALEAGDDDDCEFTFVAKEYGSTDVDVNKFWELSLRRNAAGDGDMVLTSANKTTSATTINTAITGDDKKYELEYTVTLKDTAGTTTHTWFNGNFEIAVETDSTAGIIAIKNDLKVITLIDGVGKVTLVYTGTWVATDVVTLSITGGNRYGYTVAGKDITDTLS